MLMPSRVKFRKQQRGRMKGIATSGNKVSFGQFGLKALEPTWITARQIEAARVCINRTLKKGGKLWIRIFPDKSVTKKAAETRMGSGKGDIDRYVCVIKPGRMIIEVAGVDETVARQALKDATYKLPFKSKIVMKGEL